MDTKHRSRADQRIAPRVQQAPQHGSGKSSHFWIKPSDNNPRVPDDVKQRTRADQRINPRVQKASRGLHEKLWSEQDMVMQPGTRDELTPEHREYVKQMQWAGASDFLEILPRQDPFGAIMMDGRPEYTRATPLEFIPAHTRQSFDQAIQTELYHWDQAAQTEIATRTMATMTEDHVSATGELQDIDATVLPLVELAVRNPSAFAKQLHKLHQLQAHEALFAPDKENLAFYGENNVWDMPSEKVKRECVRLEGRAVALARQLESCLMPPILHDPPPPAYIQNRCAAPPSHLSLAANVPSDKPLPAAAYHQCATRRQLRYSSPRLGPQSQSFPDGRRPRQRMYCPGVIPHMAQSAAIRETEVVPHMAPQASSAPSAARHSDETGGRLGDAYAQRSANGSTSDAERMCRGSMDSHRVFREGTDGVSHVNSVTSQGKVRLRDIPSPDADDGMDLGARHAQAKLQSFEHQLRSKYSIFGQHSGPFNVTNG